MVRIARTDVSSGGIVVAASTVLLAIAAFLPWLTASVDASVSLNGLGLFSDGSPLFNGVVTVVFGLVATVLALAAPDSDGATVVSAILGGLVTLVALTFVVAPETALGGGIGGTLVAGVSDAGLGVYLSILAGIGVFAGGVIAYSE